MQRLLWSNYIMTLLEFEYPMNNPSVRVGRMEGSMEVGQVRGSLLVRGSNACFPCLGLMI